MNNEHLYHEFLQDPPASEQEWWNWISWLFQALETQLGLTLEFSNHNLESNNFFSEIKTKTSFGGILQFSLQGTFSIYYHANHLKISAVFQVYSYSTRLTPFEGREGVLQLRWESEQATWKVENWYQEEYAFIDDIPPLGSVETGNKNLPRLYTGNSSLEFVNSVIASPNTLWNFQPCQQEFSWAFLPGLPEFKLKIYLNIQAPLPKSNLLKLKLFSRALELKTRDSRSAFVLFYNRRGENQYVVRSIHLVAENQTIPEAIWQQMLNLLYDQEENPTAAQIKQMLYGICPDFTVIRFWSEFFNRGDRAFRSHLQLLAPLLQELSRDEWLQILPELNPESFAFTDYLLVSAIDWRLAPETLVEFMTPRQREVWASLKSSGFSPSPPKESL